MQVLWVMTCQLIKTIVFKSSAIDQLAASPLAGMADIAAQLEAEMTRLLDGKRLWDYARDRIQAVQPLVDYRKVAHTKNTKSSEIWNFQMLLADKALSAAGGAPPDCSPAAIERIARETLRTTAIKSYDTPIPGGLSDSTTDNNSQQPKGKKGGEPGKRNNPKKRKRAESAPAKTRETKRQKTDPKAVLPPYRPNDRQGYLAECKKLRLHHGRFRRWGKLKNLDGTFYALPWSRLRLTPKDSYDANDKHVKLLQKYPTRFPHTS